MTRIRACEVCEARRSAMLLVHVQSPRKPSKAFCGHVLRGDGVDSVGTPGGLPPPMYVSPERAREIARDSGSRLPICSGCEVNLSRFDEAMRRKIGRVAEQDRNGVAQDEDGMEDGIDDEPSAPARSYSRGRSGGRVVINPPNINPPNIKPPNVKPRNMGSVQILGDVPIDDLEDDF